MSNAKKITRRCALKAGLGAVVLSRMVHTGVAGETKSRRPNILFLMSDQHRGDCVGADGNLAISTPNMDRIAAEGARFSCAYTSVPSCTPARAGILTGLAPWRHGQIGYGRVARRYKHEMPRMVRAAGYYTLGIGKMHFHPQRNTHGYHKTILDESGRVQSKGFVSDYRQWFRKQAPLLDPDASGLGWNDHRAKFYTLP
ncbi:MAG: sulfatase-like hydrolase/transferase, partial [Pirellulales bacterium]|nr:sulfatase-like hydrolase/transferase [Pirellulales bacterium]